MYKETVLYLSKYKFIRKIFIKVLLRNQFESNLLRKIFKTNFNIEVGMYSYGCFNNQHIPNNTKIGNYCSIGPDIKIFNANHPSEYVLLHPYLYNTSLKLVNTEPIQRNSLSIGHDVWIGANTIILPNVKFIGNGAIIGAGSIVTKNIPDFAIVVGNPAKIKKFRFSEEMQELILKSNIYNYSKENLVKILPYLYEESEFRKFIKQDKIR